MGPHTLRHLNPQLAVLRAARRFFWLTGEWDHLDDGGFTPESRHCTRRFFFRNDRRYAQVMKRVLPALVVLVPLLATPANAQDFEKGLAAAESGDYETALREWRPLAKKGDAEAQYYLGSMYDRGIGVQQDYGEAAKWYRRAAERGDADAQNNLGAMYINGNGVPLDYVRAHMWFNLAAAQDNKSANENRDIAAKQMTPADLSKAERMALEWRKKHPR
jgi:hypothetical protein